MTHQLDHREHQKKHVVLWAAVAATMAVIVALWVILLPLQLKKARAAWTQNAPHWGVVQTKSPATSWSEEMAKIRGEIDAAERQTVGSGAASAQVDLLRQKIEAASQTNAEQTH